MAKKRGPSFRLVPIEIKSQPDLDPPPLEIKISNGLDELPDHAFFSDDPNSGQIENMAELLDPIFLEDIDNNVRECLEILKQTKDGELPDLNWYTDKWTWKEKQWQIDLTPPDVREPCEPEEVSVFDYVKDRYEMFEPVWYAAKYLSHFQMSRQFVETGSRISEQREFFLMGQTIAELHLMNRHRADAVHGKLAKLKLQQGRANKRAEELHRTSVSYAQWQREANKVWEQHPDWGKSRVAKQIKINNPEIEASDNTIRQKIVRKNS